MNWFNKSVVLASIISISFFLLSLFTLSDYGISWDEPIHFHRGQGYLHYFLTGEKEFTNVSGNQSYFQSNSLPAAYFFEKDSGHPPLNGILASLTNYIFYQQLGIMGDIESHHLFNIFIASVLVFIVVIFSAQTFGLFAGTITGLSLILYPLFFAESRFNIKDPAEAAFFGLTIYAFWKALNTWSWKWLFLSAISFGLGLGTKFNILFLPFILIPWTIYKVVFLDKLKTKLSKKLLFVILLSPFIVLIIFFGSWPYLWENSLNRLIEIFGYYKQIGSGFNHQTSTYYLPFGINSYPVIWITYTTPPMILFLSLIGFFAALFNYKRKDGVTVLWLLWLLLPILRVIAPGTSIYGGVRQIMEYIPAMALIAGLGAYTLKNFVVNKLPQLSQKLLVLLFLLGFIQITIVLINMHPNQNVYFNSLVGGLKGARDKDIPSWGNSLGNAYYQATNWLNQNAETDAKIALVQGTALNIPKITLRKDLVFNNSVWSGMNRQGEYMLELTHQNPVRAYPYAWDYIERVLEPVHEIKVDGVAIAKIWKNDLQNSKEEFRRSEENLEFLKTINQDEKFLMISLLEPVNLSRITINYSVDNCEKPSGEVMLSMDGQNFIREPDPYPNEFVTESEKTPNTIYQYFAVPKTQYVKFVDKSENSCIFKSNDIKVMGFK